MSRRHRLYLVGRRRSVDRVRRRRLGGTIVLVVVSFCVLSRLLLFLAVAVQGVADGYTHAEDSSGDLLAGLDSEAAKLHAAGTHSILGSPDLGPK